MLPRLTAGFVLFFLGAADIFWGWGVAPLDAALLFFGVVLTIEGWARHRIRHDEPSE